MITPPRERHSGETIFRILEIIKSLRELKSLDAILDRLLLKARRLVHADAGTIFLVEDRTLVFSYVHNDSLFSTNDVSRHVYLNARLPIDGTSLAGYTARTNQPVVIDDAYAIDPALPVTFNASFDSRAGYRTRAVVSLPLVSTRNRVIAVLQVLNPINEAGAPVLFSPDDLGCLCLLADQAAVAIETALVTEDFILRMGRMAELRDPGETGAHVKRVGAYAAEIYHVMAGRFGLPPRELKRRKDMMRIAAMLHDVGKVGISDKILNKPGPLTDAEYEIMKRHTVLGAGLFTNPSCEIDVWTRDVVLNHHQRFDGSGYPDEAPGPTGEAAAGKQQRAGEDISLPARITAVADVYDALVSRRVYKPPFEQEDAAAILRQEAGRHFDPAVVEAFFSIQDVVMAIREKYPD
jgi:hypothetical protein